MVIGPALKSYNNTGNAEQKIKPAAPFLGSEKKCFVRCCFAPHHMHKKRKNKKLQRSNNSMVKLGSIK